MAIRLGVKKCVLVFLASVLIAVSAYPKKSDAFVQIAIGGLAVGEALFYTAAVIASGYTLYEAYDAFKNDSLTAKFLKESAGAAWSKLSADAKAGWATLEDASRAAGAKVTLTAQQWMDAVKAGLASWGNEAAGVPALDLPGTDFEFSISTMPQNIEASWVQRYSIMAFTMNGVVFQLVPQEISKFKNTSTDDPRILYTWVMANADGTYSRSYSLPGAASTFKKDGLLLGVPRSMSGDGSGSVSYFYVKAGSYRDSYSSTTSLGLGFIYPDFDTMTKGYQDAVVAMQLYMRTVYGGTVVVSPKFPAIPASKDTRKPVAFPVPPGALDVPGELALDGTVIDSIGEIANPVTDTPVPGEGTVPDWNSTPSERLNWEPLKMTGVVFTKSFPFSIPWDLYRQLQIFDVAPKAPKFEVDAPGFFQLDGHKYGMKFTIDLATFDPVAVAIRWIGTIAFDVGVILAMRRFMPE